MQGPKYFSLAPGTLPCVRCVDHSQPAEQAVVSQEFQDMEQFSKLLSSHEKALCDGRSFASAGLAFERNNCETGPVLGQEACLALASNPIVTPAKKAKGNGADAVPEDLEGLTPDKVSESAQTPKKTRFKQQEDLGVTYKAWPWISTFSQGKQSTISPKHARGPELPCKANLRHAWASLSLQPSTKAMLLLGPASARATDHNAQSPSAGTSWATSLKSAFRSLTNCTLRSAV